MIVGEGTVYLLVAVICDEGMTLRPIMVHPATCRFKDWKEFHEVFIDYLGDYHKPSFIQEIRGKLKSTTSLALIGDDEKGSHGYRIFEYSTDKASGSFMAYLSAVTVYVEQIDKETYVKLFWEEKGWDLDV